MISRSHSLPRFTDEAICPQSDEDHTPSKPLVDANGHSDGNATLRPRAVAQSTSSILFRLLLDVTLFALSAAFLAFGWVVRAYSGSPVAEHRTLTNTLLTTAKYVSIAAVLSKLTLTEVKGPTIFPILFAAVGSRATSIIIQWRLQRGERIGILDLLASSTSVSGAVMAQISLRVFSIVGTSCVLLWAFSPIGGQASLRVVGTGNTTTTVPDTFTYVTNNQSFYEYFTATDLSEVTIVNALFLTSLISSEDQRLASVDPWNNVKIPMLEPLEKTSSRDAQG